VHGVALGAGVRDALDELEELGRVDDRVGDRGVLDQLLLRDLRAHVAALGQPLAAHDRQRDVVPDAGLALGAEQGAGRRMEELQRRRVLERRGVRHVDHHRRADEGLRQPFAGDRVDAARLAGGRLHLVAVVAELGHELRADQPAAADDDDVHGVPFASGGRLAQLGAEAL
jgi:hypothetical protein